MNKTPQSKESVVLQMYKDGQRTLEIAHNLKLHRTTVQRILKRNEVKFHDKYRVHPVNENVFNKLNTQEKAYILGLLYADGYLSDRGYIAIGLHHKDRHILEEISKFFHGYVTLKENKNIVSTFKGKTYNCANQFKYVLSSTKIVNDLKKLGLHQRKSLTIRMPKISSSLIPHFIRGYFDGDGCLHIAKLQGNNRISIVSNPEFCQDLKKIIEDEISIRCCIFHKTSNVNSLNIYGNIQVRTFLNWIYKNARLKLQRKYQLFIENYI